MRIARRDIMAHKTASLRNSTEEKRFINRPIKNYRCGNLSGAVWFNERDTGEGIINFLTASLRRSWKDKKSGEWRDEVINLRKNDIPKAIVLLNKIQEDILLSNEAGDEDE